MSGVQKHYKSSTGMSLTKDASEDQEDIKSLTMNTSLVDSSIYRPLVHLTPPVGWMNDPNGLFYDSYESTYHVYYQYNPNDTIWGLPLYWGHATSDDLLTWDHHAPAIGPENDDEGIYSGSIVIDYNNTSGFFDDSTRPEQRIVAIYTNNLPDVETQDIAYSTDGGYTFEKYENNPVIDVNSTQFRDPKVIWYEETEQWVMTVAKSQEYKIQIYTSDNLKDWSLASNFSTKGYVGYQYECPGLFEATIENPKSGDPEKKWVMVLAINPGSPLGGSINEYFVGDFNGTEFIPDDDATRFMDTGKDFYAFQAFFNAPENRSIGVAWASNWQYSNQVPDPDGYRSSMSSIREYTLRYVSTNPESEQLILCQKPFFVNETDLKVADEYKVSNSSLTVDHTFGSSFANSNTTGLLDFNMTFTVNGTTDVTQKDTVTFELRIKSNESDEAIALGYDYNNEQFYINRATESYFQRTNQFFQERWSTYVQPLTITESGDKQYQLYGLVDNNILELYFNDGAFTSTNTFFLEKGKPSNVDIVASSSKEAYTVDQLTVRRLTVDE